MLRALLIRRSRCRLQPARITLDEIGQHGRARSLNMIGTRFCSVNFALGCLFTCLVRYLPSVAVDGIATGFVAVVLTITCLGAIVISITQMQKHGAAGAAMGGAGAAGAEVEADSPSRPSSAIKSLQRPLSLVLPGEDPLDVDEAVDEDEAPVAVDEDEAPVPPVPPVPPPCLRTPRTRRGFGAVLCLQRSVVRWRTVRRLRVTARRLAAACRLQRSWRRLISARLLYELFLTAVRERTTRLRTARWLQRRWRGIVAARQAAFEQDQRSGLFLEQNRGTFCHQPGSSYLVGAARLGAGTFGVVFQPRKMNGGLRDLAAKVVSLRADGDRDAQDLLATEARLLLLANAYGGHENVLRIRAAFVVDGHACIALDLAGWGDLYDYMACARLSSSARMPEREGFQYAMQLAAALAFLHECGVAHRDIKLENVLLMRPGHVVIADLGCGVELSTLAPSGGLSDKECGTLMTMAPEVHGGRWYDPRPADVWSLGATVLALVAPHMYGYYAWSTTESGVDDEYLRYETLLDVYAEQRSMINAGQISWPAEVPQPTAIGGLLQSDEYDTPKLLPPALLMVLDGMLRPEPDERFTAAEVHSHLVLMLMMLK